MSSSLFEFDPLTSEIFIKVRPSESKIVPRSTVVRVGQTTKSRRYLSRMRSSSLTSPVAHDPMVISRTVSFLDDLAYNSLTYTISLQLFQKKV
jgi:hypothetical protein